MQSLTVEMILTVLAALVGVPAAIAFLIDVGKWTGLIKDGTAPRWSAALNLIALIAVAAILKFYPHVDLPTADLQLLELVKFGALIFQYVIQITVTRAAHNFYAHTLGIVAFSWTLKAWANVNRMSRALDQALADANPDPERTE